MVRNLRSAVLTEIEQLVDMGISVSFNQTLSQNAGASTPKNLLTVSEFQKLIHPQQFVADNGLICDEL